MKKYIIPISFIAIVLGLLVIIYIQTVELEDAEEMKGKPILNVPDYMKPSNDNYVKVLKYSLMEMGKIHPLGKHANLTVDHFYKNNSCMLNKEEYAIMVEKWLNRLVRIIDRETNRMTNKNYHTHEYDYYGMSNIGVEMMIFIPENPIYLKSHIALYYVVLFQTAMMSTPDLESKLSYLKASDAYLKYFKKVSGEML